MRYLPALFLALLLNDAALADAPPEPTGTQHRQCSLNGRWCVDFAGEPGSNEKATALRVQAQGAGPRPTGWTATVRLWGWPAITNDGACLVDLATGSNLIAPDKSPHDPAFVFHCKAQAPVVLAIDSFIADFDALPRSTSHRIWARSFGLDARNHLIVRTAEGRDFLIDPRNGKLLKGAYVR